MLIDNDGSGFPQPGSGKGHFVRVSNNPTMHPVNQILGNGQWPNADCGDACISSFTFDMKKPVLIREIELLSGTFAGGTSIPGLMNALAALRYANHYVASTPPPGWIMNPAWGGLIPPAQSRPYIAASRGQCIVIDVKPLPPPTPLGAPDVNVVIIENWNNQEHMFEVDGNGDLWHYWYAGAQGWLGERLASALRPFGALACNQQATALRVASVRADGRTFRATQFANEGKWTVEEVSHP